MQITKTKDLTGIPCPMSFVKTKLALHEIQVGETIKILLDCDETIKNVKSSCLIEKIAIIQEQDESNQPCFLVLQKE